MFQNCCRWDNFYSWNHDFLKESLRSLHQSMRKSIDHHGSILILGLFEVHSGPFFIEFLHFWCSPNVTSHLLGQVAWAKKVLGLNFRARDLKTAGGVISPALAGGKPAEIPGGSSVFDGHLGDIPMFRHSEMSFFLFIRVMDDHDLVFWSLNPWWLGGSPISGNLRISDVIWYLKWSPPNDQQPRGEYESRVDISYGSQPDYGWITYSYGDFP